MVKSVQNYLCRNLFLIKLTKFLLKRRSATGASFLVNFVANLFGTTLLQEHFWETASDIATKKISIISRNMIIRGYIITPRKKYVKSIFFSKKKKTKQRSKNEKIRYIIQNFLGESTIAEIINETKYKNQVKFNSTSLA